MNDKDLERYLKKFELVPPSVETGNKILAYSEARAKELITTSQPGWLDSIETILRILGFNWLIAIRCMLWPKEEELIKVTLI